MGEEEEHQARLLRNLVTLDMLAGQVVDWQVNSLIDRLRRGDPENDADSARAAEVFDRLLIRSAEWAQALRNGKSLAFGSQPLLEDFYETGRDTAWLDRCRARVIDAIKGFLTSGVWETLHRIPTHRWMPEWDPSAFSAQEIKIDSLSVFVSPDFWIDYQERGLIILDWKASRFFGNDERLQLSVYSLWGQISRNLPSERVRVQAIHLPASPKLEAASVLPSELDLATTIIREDSEFERSRVSPRTLADGQEVFWADRETFAAEPAVGRCSICRFKGICPDALI